MPETNEKPQLKEDICQIRIIFPMTNDAQAVAAKAKIDAILADVPDSQMHFTISTRPNKGADYGGVG